MSTQPALGRLMNLIPYLSRRQGERVEVICRELGIEPRDLLADIRMISALSYGNWGEGDLVDIYLDHDRIQVHTGGLFEHRLRFTQPEMAALLSGWNHLKSIGMKDYLPGMESALRHLRDELTGGSGGDPEEIGKRVRYQLAVPADEELVPQVLRATEQHRALLIRYDSVNSNTHRERQVEPWHCICRNGVWYLIGRDTASGEQRTFRMDRISELEVLDHTIEVPADFRPETDHTIDRLRSPGPRMEVRIRLGGTLLEIAREDRWEDLEETPEGTVLRLGETNGNWVIRMLLPWCDQCEILSPPELRARMASTLDDLLALSDGTAGNSI